MCQSASNAADKTKTGTSVTTTMRRQMTTTAAVEPAVPPSGSIPSNEVLVDDATYRKNNGETTSGAAASTMMKPSMSARYTCASIMVAIFAVWGQWTFGSVADETKPPTGPDGTLHSWKVPVVFGLFYLVSLPILKALCQIYLWQTVDVRALLTEAMIVYNAGQVLLNGWMVYRIMYALVYGGHPFIQGTGDVVATGTTFAVWVHYTDKYLEFMDTYFMVLRGKMDQVSFQDSFRPSPCRVRLVVVC